MMKENGGAIAAAKKKVKKEDSAILLKKSQNKGKSTDEANSVDNLTIEDDDGTSTREECYMMDIVTRSSDEWSDSESDSPSIDAH
jgi:hypothetical protein